MGAFDEILADIGVADEDRSQLAAFGVKYPKLNEAVIRQTEFNRQLNLKDQEISRRDQELSGVKGELSQWSGWKSEAWDTEKKMTKAEAQAREQLELSVQRIQELEAGTGADMTFEEMEAGLAQRGFVKKDVVEQEVGRVKTSVIEETDKKLNTQANNFEFLWTKTTPLIRKYYESFQEDLDISDFLKFAAQRNELGEPAKAFEAYVQPKQDQVRLKKLEEERAKAFEDGKKAGLQERGMEHLPVDQDGEGSGPALSARFNASPEQGGPPKSGKFNAQEIAHQGVQAYREGKYKSTQAE